MNPDLPGLSLNDGSYSPTIDIPALDTQPLNSAADIPAVQPAAPANQSSGFDISQVTSTLVNMFDTGVTAFNNVAKTLGTPQIGVAATPAVAAPVPVLGGLTSTQLWIIGGAVGVLGLLLILRKR